jgi:tRNA A-37 threonylcarbamoyl transferase component Bud32
VVKYSEIGLVARRWLQVGPHRVEVFVKHYPWRRRLAVIADLFRASRARRTFKLGHQLLAREVPTALPLAYIERRVGRVLIESILITEAVPRSVELRAFVQDELEKLPPRQRTRLRQSMAAGIGQVIARMYRAGWVQRDLKAPNVLVQHDGQGRPTLTFIDLDGVRSGGRDRFRPLIRLNDGLWGFDALTLSDRLRVLRSYLGPRTDWKPIWREILEGTLNRRRGRGQ